MKVKRITYTVYVLAEDEDQVVASFRSFFEGHDVGMFGGQVTVEKLRPKYNKQDRQAQKWFDDEAEIAIPLDAPSYELFHDDQGESIGEDDAD